jgi:hypothetical protein
MLVHTIFLAELVRNTTKGKLSEGGHELSMAALRFYEILCGIIRTKPNNNYEDNNKNNHWKRISRLFKR